MILVIGSIGIAPVEAQPDVENATDSAADAVTDEPDDPDEDTNETIITQFDGGGSLDSVEYRDGSTYVTVSATDGEQRFAISEDDLKSEGHFEYTIVSVDSGETLTVELPVTKAAVTVTTNQDGYYYPGSVGPPIITGQTTEELIQIAAISGILGSILSLGTAAGYLKRKHKNSYKELFSDERKEIERDAFEGWRDRIISWIRDRGDSKLSTAVGLGILGYVGLVVLGQAPAPGDLWLSLSDSQRLVTAGTVASTIVALPAMYYLADRLYDPDRDFVLDLDSQDVYKAKSGDKSGTVAAYSAPPDRISEMDVDGAPTTITTPGGRCHLVRGFDPETNEAAANPPELENDRLVSIYAEYIKKNRGVLQDLALIGRDLIAGMTSFRVIADTKSMKDIDNGLRDTVSAGSDSLDGVLSDAVEGTRYEGAYDSPEELREEIDEQLPMTDNNDSDDTTNEEGSIDE